MAYTGWMSDGLELGKRVEKAFVDHLGPVMLVSVHCLLFDKHLNLAIFRH